MRLDLTHTSGTPTLHIANKDIDLIVNALKWFRSFPGDPTHCDELIWKIEALKQPEEAHRK